MIEVLLHAFGERQMRRVLVVVVLLEDGNIRFRERFDDAARDGGLARAGAAADADDERLAVSGDGGCSFVEGPGTEDA